MERQENLHAGHRQRMKRRFLELGERGMDDHQLLELLLFYAIPRKDTNLLAHQLINRFGSLSGVLNASPNELRQVKDIGDSAVVLLELVPQLARRCWQQENGEDAIVRNEREAAEYLRPYFFGVRREQVYLLSIDRKGKVLGCDFLGEGGDNAVGLDTRLLTETALRHRAAWVVLAHSHPSGLAMPSQADIATTRSCKCILRALEIDLRDHLVFADDDYVSMRESGLMG